MPAKRTHVVIPEELVSAIDRLVGNRGRSRFIAEAAAREIRRLAQLQALDAAVGCWKSGEHPELKGGAAKWVEGLRKEADDRYRRVAKR
jgi:Arc/MetJ-type ribon-helix-helix transcriptional regulator